MEAANREEKAMHTLGPWTSAAEVQQLDLGESIEVFAGNANAPIAMVMNFDDFPCLEEEKAEDFDIEAQANARLIAAAPSLYEALQKAKETICAFNGIGLPGALANDAWEAYQHSPEMKVINAALALVKGE
jgi:hypothetical protein